MSGIMCRIRLYRITLFHTSHSSRLFFPSFTPVIRISHSARWHILRLNISLRLRSRFPSHVAGVAAVEDNGGQGTPAPGEGRAAGSHTGERELSVMPVETPWVRVRNEMPRGDDCRRENFSTHESFRKRLV